MSRAIIEAMRLQVLETGDAVEYPHWHDLGAALVTSSGRLGYRGVLEVVGKPTEPLAASTVDFMRRLQHCTGKPDAIRRWRLTRPDDAVIEGDYDLETFVHDGATFELVISAVGEIEEHGERDEDEDGDRKVRMIESLAAGARDGFGKVGLTLVETRPPEVSLEEAVSAVLTGGLSGLLALMRAAADDLTPEEIAQTVLDGTVALLKAEEAAS